MKKDIRPLFLIGVVVVVSLVMRLIPHPANFVPIGALALISGLYIRSRWGIVVPLLVMVASDLIVGWHNLVLFTWGSYLLMGMIGWWVRQHKSVWRVAGGTLLGSVLFFVITNFAVWAFTPLYAKTAAGLVHCFYMALPFFRNTVLGDFFYVGIFVGLYEAVYFLVTSRQQKKVVVERTA